MYIFYKNKSIKLSEYFTSTEFECKCNYTECNKQWMSKELVDKLNLVRKEIDEPILITSAYRCSKKQQDLRGSGIKTAKSKSTHEMACAVDVAIKDMQDPIKYNNLLKVLETHFKSIGIATNFFHVDLRVDKDKRRWDY